MGFLTSFVTIVVIGGGVTWIITRSNKRYRYFAKQLDQDGSRLPAHQVHQEAAHGQQEPRTAATDHRGPWSATRETVASDATAIITMDRFEYIEGIEPVFVRRLNQAGILTYADLAVQPPERVQAIISPDKPRDLPVHDWIAQARALADSDADHESANAS